MDSKVKKINIMKINHCFFRLYTNIHVLSWLDLEGHKFVEDCDDDELFKLLNSMEFAARERMRRDFNIDPSRSYKWIMHSFIFAELVNYLPLCALEKVKKLNLFDFNEDINQEFIEKERQRILDTRALETMDASIPVVIENSIPIKGDAQIGYTSSILFTITLDF